MKKNGFCGKVVVCLLFCMLVAGRATPLLLLSEEESKESGITGNVSLVPTVALNWSNWMHGHPNGLISEMNLLADEKTPMGASSVQVENGKICWSRHMER